MPASQGFPALKPGLWREAGGRATGLGVTHASAPSRGPGRHGDGALWAQQFYCLDAIGIFTKELLNRGEGGGIPTVTLEIATG